MSDLIALSVVLFALALTVTTVLHELAHAIVSWRLGGRPVLHSTFVENHELSPAAQVTTAAAGPVFSFVQGLLLAACYSAVDSWSVEVRLFILWLSLHGFVNFFGYLVTVPVAPAGDLGRVARHLRLSTPVQLIVSGVGVLANVVIGVLAKGPLLEVAVSDDLVSTAAGRRSHILEVAVLPWLLGAVLVTLCRPKPPVWLSGVYPFLSGIFTVAAWLSAGDGAVSIERDAGSVTWWPWLVAFVALVGVTRLVLDRGVHIGPRTAPSSPPG